MRMATARRRTRVGSTRSAFCSRTDLRLSLLVELIHAGLASAQVERMVAAGKPIEVARVRITEAGRRVVRGALL